MPETEVDLLGDAIAGTDKEIFDEAVDGVEAEADQAEQPDRSLEEMEEAPGAEAADESEDEGEDGEAEGEESEAEQPRDEKGKFAAKDEKPDADTKPEAVEQVERKGNPAVALREERTRRQTAEAERDAARTESQKALADMNAKLELTLREIAALKQPPVQQPIKAEETQKTKPDIFTDPEGHDRWLQEQIAEARAAAEKTVTERFINASMADAHEKHGKVFEEAFQAVSSLDRAHPANAAILRTIREAPNPGAALMRWHQQQETLREVGGDPTAYRQKIAEETKSQLLKDPEFRKQLLAEMKAEASGQTNGGKPRTLIRTPPSLNGTGGRGDHQIDPRTFDNSDRAVFESAFSD